MRSIRPALFTVLLACLALIGGPAAAEKVTLDKPVAIPANIKKADKSKLAGRVVAYDDEEFDVKLKSGDVETVRWDELDAKSHFLVRKGLIEGARLASAWIDLGRTLLPLEGGKPWAEKAFAEALKIDPGFKKQVEQIKKDGGGPPPKPATGNQGGSKPVGKKPSAGDGEDPDGGEGDDDELMRPEGDVPEGVGAGDMTGPKMVGGVQAEYWGPQSEEAQAAAVAELKEFAAKTENVLGKKLLSFETEFFLFYTDLPMKEAKNWSGLLDRMYARLAEMFAIEKGVNIWRGKAIVFIFASEGDYQRFQVAMHQTDPGGSEGMCHSYGDGMVHIAFFRQQDELLFAHVLVHESVHGFLHRYKTPVDIPSWANEGLAEWIANSLVPRRGRQNETRGNAQAALRQFGGLGNFFEAQHIQPWHYPVAEMMATYMIERNKKGYVSFINGIKEGLTWDQSLADRYKAPRDRLVPAFGKAIGVPLK